MPAGFQIFNENGGLVLDLTDYTVKEMGGYFIASITSPTVISSAVITEHSEVVVINNSGEEVSSTPLPKVYLDKMNKRIHVEGNYPFNIGIRVVEF